MLKKIGIGLVALIVVLVVVIATRPSEYRVERSAAISAPADIVFAQINDFHRWEAWSPWEKLDPTMKKTFEGAPVGVGATYYWIGNDKVGEGRMTIDQATPNERVHIKLEFIKPFAGLSPTEFTLKPEGNGVRLTWVMNGTNNFVSKAFGLFMDMDKMIGGDFERGLASIKQVSEVAAKKRAEEAAAAEAAAKKAAEEAAKAAEADKPADGTQVATPGAP